MTKAQRIIIVVAAGLIIIAILFPPFYQYASIPSEKVESISATGWTFIADLMDLITNKTGKGPGIVIRNYLRTDVFILEILGILVLAGAGVLITKKRS